MSLENWLDQKRTPITQSSDPTTRRLLAARASGENLHIRYAKPGKTENRTITVRNVFSVQGEAYIEAFCHMRKALRRFMIERVTIIDGSGIASSKPRLGVAVGPIPCSVEEIELEGDNGPIDSVEVKCSRCGHITESYGAGGASIRRCLALMAEECPLGESNYYFNTKCQE